MAKYQADVRALLEYIGGKENIRAVSHCMTPVSYTHLDVYKRQAQGQGKNHQGGQKSNPV